MRLKKKKMGEKIRRLFSISHISFCEKKFPFIKKPHIEYELPLNVAENPYPPSAVKKIELKYDKTRHP